jgi:putative ABC transport system permease protein
VLIGVAAVIAMVALGRGAASRVDADLSSMGQNLLFVVPGTPGSRGPMSRTSARPFTEADATAIARQVANIDAVAPMASSGGIAVYGGASWKTGVTGTTDAYFRVLSWKLAQGRGLTAADVRAGASVCVLGNTVRRELFASRDPLGAIIRIGDVSLRVVGTLAPKGKSTFGMDQDDFVLIPLTTFQRRVSGNRDVSIIFISASRGADTALVKRDLEALMRQRRHIRPGGLVDFFVHDMKEIAATVEGIASVLTSLLAAIAAISLLVGGIGIMNVMLVAVSERTREIGLRMSVGARRRDVLVQFLVESSVLSMIGGLVGIGIGLAGSYVATSKLGLPLTIDPVVIGIPFAFSVLVGIVFGFFPARKAARMNPIDALRSE